MSVAKLGMLLGMFLSLGHVVAQGLRDPTVPPLEARQGVAAVAGASSAATPISMPIIVRNGQPYLVVGTRLYGQGQKLGQARIERITETEVWLREGGVLRKQLQFSGIERRTVLTGAAKPACDPGRSKKSSAAPCVETHP